MSLAAPSLFSDSGYLRLWLIGLFCGVVRWLELLAFGVFAFDATGSPALVALVVMLRFLPLSLFGVFMGAFSDIVSPERLLRLTILSVMLVCAGMLAAFHFGDPGYPLIAFAAFASGVFWATDLPVRRKILASHAPPCRLTGAIALDGATSNGTRLMGPLIGGTLYQTLGMEGVFALGAGLYLAALLIALSLPTTPPAAPGRNPIRRALKGAREAWRYARSNRDVMRILLVTVAFNIWGFPYLAMIPVIGREDLELSASMIGAVTAVEGALALAGALFLTRALPEGWNRPIYWGGVMILSLTILAMGAFPGFWTLTIGLAIGGFCSAGFAVMQSTLIYQTAPVEMRGRFLGLMTISIGTGVIGFANVGLTAEVFGASNALLIIGAQGIIPLLLIARGWRELRFGGGG
ncbi:MAG: MFS transporter [Pseudomonadota bacterium]